MVLVLNIAFEHESGARFDFSVQDPNNGQEGLPSEGPDPATGNHWNGTGTYLPGVRGFFMNYRTAEDLEIVWLEIAVDRYTFSGSGYTHIKRELHWACPDSIWIGGRTVGPGDPEYEAYRETYCMPDFYFPEQKIRITSDHGEPWPDSIAETILRRGWICSPPGTG